MRDTKKRDYSTRYDKVSWHVFYFTAYVSYCICYPVIKYTFLFYLLLYIDFECNHSCSNRDHRDLISKYFIHHNLKSLYDIYFFLFKFHFFNCLSYILRNSKQQKYLKYTRITILRSY